MSPSIEALRDAVPGVPRDPSLPAAGEAPALAWDWIAARDEHATTELLEQLLEHVSDGVLAVSRDGRISYWSATLVELTGWPAARVVGRPIEAWLPDCAAALRGSGPEKVTTRITTPRGELALELAIVHARGPAGLSLGRVAAVRDLRHAWDAHAAREQQLALSRLGQMVATAAHQLRNPLGACLGFLGLLEKDLAATSSAPLLARVREGLYEMDRRIGELLDYARPRPLEMRAFDLAALVREVASGAAARFAQGPVCETRAPARLRARGDAGQLRQALENLIVNAAQAAGAGGRVRVWLRRGRSASGEPAARLLVRNTGTPLAPGELPQLFEPFVSRRPGGTGLGLPLARRVIAMHGGEIQALSAGGWTTFVATWPLDPSGDAKETA